MPYKNKSDKNEQRKKYLQVSTYLRYDTEQHIIDAVEDAAILRRTTKAEYAKAALVEKLIRDGYLRKPRD